MPDVFPEFLPARLRGRAVRWIVAFAVASPLLLAVPSGALGAAGTDRLSPGERLDAGQSITAPDGVLTMQGDGNLVLYGTPGVPLWASRTFHPRSWAVMQADGNLVVYWNDGGAVRPAWASRTAGRGPSTLVVQADGNAVVYAAGGATWSTRTVRKAYAASRFPGHGWGADQWRCLDQLWMRESGWNERAGNASGAYGIPQALPGSKMATAGPAWRTDPRTQIRWGLDYVAGRYGTPCTAWSRWTTQHWY